MATTVRRRLMALMFPLCLVARIAAAQSDPQPSTESTGRLSFGGEGAAVFGRRDNIAFFNYTDYGHDALRFARVRFVAEWNVFSRLSLLAEVRTEDGDGIDVPAAYLRWRPFTRHDFAIQAGRIPPVIGIFPRHAYGHDNLVIGAPLAYQYLISLRPDALPATIDDLLRMKGRGWQPSYPIGSTAVRPGLPVVSGFQWPTGVQGSWRREPVQIAVAVTRGAPSYPVALEGGSAGLAWSSRAAIRLPAGAVIGWSAGVGRWIDPSVVALATGPGHPSPRQSLVGVDGEYGAGRWLLRGEWLWSSFGLPMASAPNGFRSLTLWSGYAEGRYRLAPRWQLAGRVDRLQFGTVIGEVSHQATPWDAAVDRVEGALSFRVTRGVQVKGAWQYDWREGGRVRSKGFPALECLVWF